MKKQKIRTLSLLVCAALLLSFIPSAINTGEAYVDMKFKPNASSPYRVSESGSAVLGVNENTSVSELLSNFGSGLSVLKGDGTAAGSAERVYTGARLSDGTKIFEIAVTGDLNGDGVISAADYLSLKLHLKGKSELTGIYFRAADPDCDSQVTTADYFQFKRHLKNAVTLSSVFQSNRDKIITEFSQESSEAESSLESSEPEPTGTAYVLVVSVNKYPTATDAANRSNASGTAAAGTYYLFNNYPNGYNGMMNLTTDSTGASAGFWMNPVENDVNFTEESSETESSFVNSSDKTSFYAEFYSTEAKFRASPAYKSYGDFSSRVIYSESIIQPGATRTNVSGTIGTKFAPQGLCFAEKYMLISAYDRDDKLNSVIYVLDMNTKQYKTTLRLSGCSAHVGGIAYDGTNIWVCNGTSVSTFKYSLITSAVASGKDSVTVSFGATRAAGITASFCTYYNSKLWIGTFNGTTTDYMYAYTIGSKSGTPTITQVSSSSSTGYRFQVPMRTQGACFLSDGTLICSISYRASTSASDHSAELRVYSPSWSNITSTGTITKNDAIKKLYVPPMGEGIAPYGNYVYLLFESVAYPSCEYPVDRVCAFTPASLKS